MENPFKTKSLARSQTSNWSFGQYHPAIVCIILTGLFGFFPAPVHAAGGVWRSMGEPGVTAGAAIVDSFAVASNGTPYVCLRDVAGNSGVAVMKHDGIRWSVAGGGGLGGNNAEASLALSADGTPYVASSDAGENGGRATVRRFDGTNWITVGASGFTSGPAGVPSIAILTGGFPCVAYRDGGNGGRLGVLLFDGQSWLPPGAAGLPTNAVDHPKLVAGPDGRPWVAFQDAGNGNKVSVMRFDGTTWVGVGAAGFSAGGAAGLSLAFGMDGSAHVAYADHGSSGKATVMRFDGAKWVAVGSVGFSPGQVVHTSLAIPASGVPWVAFEDGNAGGRASVMTFEGGAWGMAGQTGFSAGQAVGPALAFAPGGIAYVACQDLGNAGRASVMMFTPTNTPTVVTLPATAITAGTAVLTGSINPNGTGAALFFQCLSGTNLDDAMVSRECGSTSFGFVNGDAATARFYYPYAVAVDNAGCVYVADYANHRIRKIGVDGLVTTLAGSGVAGFLDGTGVGARFNFPSGVAVDASGNVYVADSGNQRIRKIAPDGAVVTLAGSGTLGFADGSAASARFANPTGVAVDRAGNIYVGDSGNQRIRKIALHGVVSTVAGSGTNGFADGLAGVAQFSGPSGVAVDGAGTVYVADYENNRIRKITAEGMVGTVAGSGTNGYAEGVAGLAMFSGPSGVAVDGDGTVYVCDSRNNRIRRVSPDGDVRTVAGSGFRGAVDGAGPLASFSTPTGIAVDGAGDLHIVESHQIRKVVPPHWILCQDGLAGVASLTLGRTLGGLQPATTYWFRACATNVNGRAVGQTLSFTTPSRNRAPVVVLTVPDQTTRYGSDFHFALDPGVFTDPDGDTITLSATNLPPGITFDPATRTFSGVALGAGVYNVFVAAGDGRSPELTANTTFLITVSKAVLTVSALNRSRIYGSMNPHLVASYSGFVPGDSVAVLGGSLLISTPAVLQSPAGTYPINLSGLTSGNYEINLVPGILTVNRAVLTLSADSKSRSYGATNPVFTGNMAGVLNADPISLVFSTQATPLSGVGTYGIIPGLSDPSGRAGNYDIRTNTGVLTVGRALLLAEGDSRSRTYGSLNPHMLVRYTGFMNGETAAILTSLPVAQTAATRSSPVGDYQISVAGGAGANYEVVLVPGVLTITKAPLTVSCDNFTRLEGQENPVLTGSLAGVVAGDAITAGYTTTAVRPSPPGTYPIVPVLGDPDGKLGNYIVTTNAGVLTVKAPATGGVLVVDASNIHLPAPNGGVLIRLQGTANQAYRIEASGNLVGWDVIGRGVAGTNGVFEVRDAQSGSLARRFYRAATE